MTDINEENKDLIKNTTPFGLLDEETQERMMAWEHGWKVWNGIIADGWFDVASSSQFAANSGYVFRAKPAPEPEPVEVRHELSITVESPLLPKEMHYLLSVNAKLEDPKIEAIE